MTSPVTILFLLRGEVRWLSCFCFLDAPCLSCFCFLTLPVSIPLLLRGRYLWLSCFCCVTLPVSILLLLRGRCPCLSCFCFVTLPCLSCCNFFPCLWSLQLVFAFVSKWNLFWNSPILAQIRRRGDFLGWLERHGEGGRDTTANAGRALTGNGCDCWFSWNTPCRGLPPQGRQLRVFSTKNAAQAVCQVTRTPGHLHSWPKM